jgi:hypothetical protein
MGYQMFATCLKFLILDRLFSDEFYIPRYLFLQIKNKIKKYINWKIWLYIYTTLCR